MVKRTRRKAIKKEHQHFFTNSVLACGCIYRDGYILITPEQQVQEAFVEQIKNL